MELAAQCEERGLDLHLDWVPREVNAEADALADGDFEGFSEDKRIEADLAEVTWLVLNGLLREGQEFYEKGVGRGPPCAPAPRPARRERLRDRDPW